MPALRNVTNLGSSVDAIAPHVSQWHGVNLPLIFSVIVIIVGLILALKVNWKAITHQVIKYASLQILIAMCIEDLNVIQVK